MVTINYLKYRKSTFYNNKSKVQRKIVELYHNAHGVPGYRMMRNLMVPYGYIYSNLTVYNYMKELGLRSIVCRKRPTYQKGKTNKIFPNLLNQNFKTESKNLVWCTDFTCLYLSDRTVRNNCTILDLFDRSVIASLNGVHITAELAIETLKISIQRHKHSKGIILHSDYAEEKTMLKKV